MTEAGQGSTVDMYGEHDAIHIRHDELLQALDTGGDIARAAANFRRSLTVHFDNEEELIFAEAPRWLPEEANRSILDKLRRLDREGPVSD